MKSLRIPFLAALIGGALAAIVLLAVGVDRTSHTTTIIQQAPTAQRADAAATQSASSAPQSSSSATDTGLTAHAIYEQDAPGVVSIRSTIEQQTASQSTFDPFNLFGQSQGQGQQPQQQEEQATGSGIVLDKNGTILTNWHVVQGASKVTVQFGAQGNPVTAKVIGTDPSDDLALLSIPTSGLTLTPLPLGDSSTVQVGDPTLAIGNPFGLDRTLTTGVVSALQRSIVAPNGFSIDNVIQTDAPINPGNSGGPLLNSAGQVIGINSQIETGDGGNGSVGIGFAIPINRAKTVIPTLEKDGKLSDAYLGLTTFTIDGTLGDLNLPVSSGALVQSVLPGTPAAKAGIQAGTITATTADDQQIVMGGDIIVAIDGQPVATSQDLGNYISTKKPGDTVTITVLRNDKRVNLQATLTTRPASVANPDTPQG